MAQPQPQPQPQIIIRENPIGKGLDAFRALFKALCAVEDVGDGLEKALDQLGPKDVRDLHFDVNKDGLRFVYTILGFLYMDEEQLGFDPTIITTAGERYTEITRDGQTERLIIDELMQPHRAGDPQTLLVTKDSWQYSERQEGQLLDEATRRGVVNVARYYRHETVHVRRKEDDVRHNVRGGLDVTTAEMIRLPRRSAMSPLTSAAGVSETRLKGVRNRSSSLEAARLPPSKRSRSESSATAEEGVSANRIHRRVILRDYGRPIFTASSRESLLGALEACITGHESLHDAVNEDEDNVSWPAFLIGLDLGTKEARLKASGVKGNTGTRAFMAIDVLRVVLLVLFWICIHYKGPGRGRVIPEFDKWNYIDMATLAYIKQGQVSDERDFTRLAQENFTPFYRPLTPWVNRLRRVVFPNGYRHQIEDAGLHLHMREVLQAARETEAIIEGGAVAE
ncbi:hypothetical protein B0T26DRAFT_812360 [Lasiosphaeria miniovina]|uniref:Fungal-type protein kinase domain-containing protein n=1 Tax=Lasiosphaeria miniovina TaxID=1954250 RepID=A0AA40AKQ4_9PEZI|nr:uncharacterized protein B0T26DRAFT_812360 [Lasiosphaeria miniovina]KAK0717641.1 hypothetical protein B0T26DRAFT_812360 [Lasiosphaeria miniovina]